ncbi:hypothetical protein TNCV_3315891 [Trichonephila clavipes]|nr:hypothetical protein TNCV_3315891 [Trichonephila clavipes]
MTTKTVRGTKCPDVGREIWCQYIPDGPESVIIGEQGRDEKPRSERRHDETEIGLRAVSRDLKADFPGVRGKKRE